MGPDNQVLFFKRAFKLSYRFWLDKLDCSVSFARQKVPGATFEDAMSHFGDHCLPSFILRKPLAPIDGPLHFEVGFRKMGRDVDWFLYLLVDYYENGLELMQYFEHLGGLLPDDTHDSNSHG